MVVRPGFEEGVEEEGEEEARAGEAERLLEDENGRAASVGACLLVPMPCGMWTVVAWWGRWGAHCPSRMPMVSRAHPQDA